MKLWERKEKKVLDSVEEFEVGKDYIYDREIALHDIKGSIAHVKMLNKIGILSDEEVRKIVLELEHLYEKFKKQPPALSISDEDIHTYIENRLVSALGELGKKIHTGRSRNDQVITALRLYEKEKVSELIEGIDRVLKKLVEMSKKFKGMPFIGYTHLRQAMPTTVDVWLGSLIEALEDDRALFRITLDFIDRNPLGSSAGYGVPLNLDREYTTKLLGFGKLIENPLYCQNTRGKYESILIFAIALLIGDLARFSSDIVIFSSDEFGFVKLGEEITTGSSIMPHKRNPDAFELIRAKFKKILGYLVSTMSITFSVMSGYNKDLQETKETTIESIKEALKILGVFEKMLDYINFDEEAVYAKASKKIFSADIAFEIVKNFNLPFREAYRKVSEIVDLYTDESSLPLLREKFSDSISLKVIEFLSMDVRELFRICIDKRSKK
ncbi:MAG: argininosuccinate lyase [Brevinematia bacterium]